ncbi:MAG TPA: hypothetical protein VF092_15780 [Longimicrobium sp.]
MTAPAPDRAGGQYQEVPVASIQLDEENPRIAAFLDAQEPPYTAEMIFLALGAGGDEDGNSGPTFSKLKQSILTNRGIVQPVILRLRDDGQFVCIEGNTRVALYKDFLAAEIPGPWERIPSIVHEQITEEDVHAIRLQAHLVGPRQWDPYSKAKYLTYLRNVANFSADRLVDFCGGSRRAVTELLDAYSDMEHYYRPLLESDADFDLRRFSGFVELQKSGVKDAIVRSGHTFSDFAQWIIDERIDKLAHVRWLPKILRDRKATEVFLKDGIEQAIRIVEGPDTQKQLHDVPLAALCRALAEAVNRIEFRDVRKMKDDPTSPTAQHLLEAYEALQEIVNEVGLV